MNFGFRTALRSLRDRFLYSPNPRPVFVFGFQKSGTSAVTHLLADRCGRSKTIDIAGLWYPVNVQLFLKQYSLADFVKKNPKPFSTDFIKEPCLTYLFDEIDELFPEAKHLFVVRDPRDNIRSILNRLELPGNLEAPDRKLSDAWNILFNPALISNRETHYIGQLADWWTRAAQIYLANKSRMALVRFEDFIRDKLNTIDTCAASLDFKPIHDISDKLDREFQYPGVREVDWAAFFGAENLARINRLCGGLMDEFQYDATRTKYEIEA